MTTPTPPPPPQRADALPEAHAAEADDDVWPAEHRVRTARAEAQARTDQDRELARLSNGWSMRLAARQGVAPLVTDLARDLVAAGFTLHDCAAPAQPGGVCLTPLTDQPGVVVSWTTHVALDPSLSRYAQRRSIHDAMNHAVADVLAVMGWPVTPHGPGGAYYVTGRPRRTPTTASLFDPGDEEGDQG